MVVPLPLLSNSTKIKMKQEKQYDVIIVGGSYAGLATAMALGRALRKVLIIDSGDPCNGDSVEVDHSIPLQADQGFRWKLTR